MMNAFASGIHDVHAQAAGALEVCIVARDAIPRMTAAAMMGDAGCRRLLVAIGSALEGMERAPKRQPPLCATCDRALTRTLFCFAVAIPMRDDPTTGLALGICERCAPHPDDAMAKATIALAKIWPDLRQIDVHAGSGSA